MLIRRRQAGRGTVRLTHNSCWQTEDLTPYKNQAKQLFKQLSANVEDSRCSVETGPYVFQCVLFPVLFFWRVPSMHASCAL